MKTRLDELKEWSFSVLDELDENKSYKIAFSGGKDSSVLLGIFADWLTRNEISLFRRQELFKVVFSDTLLEAPGLYTLVAHAQSFSESIGLPFYYTAPTNLHREYWVVQFGYGYPVPNHANRWCTNFLKVRPMQKVHGVALTGRHIGESSNRDSKLSKCGSIECGIDLISGTIDPIARWTNCDIWDWIALEGDTCLYTGFSRLIHATYDITDSDKGLRMGCFMCPVISANTIKKNQDLGISPPFSLAVRGILEDLRKEPRLNNPRTKKAGTILCDSRVKHWARLKKFFPQMIEYGFITEEIIGKVDLMLEAKTYPPLYRQEWIDAQETLLQKEPLQLNLSITI